MADIDSEAFMKTAAWPIALRRKETLEEIDARLDALEDAGGGGPGGGSLVSDLTPQLGGDLDVNGMSIVSVSDGAILIEPHGTGRVQLTTDTVHIGKSLQHIGDTDTQMLFSDGGNEIVFQTESTTRLGLNSSGMRIGTSGARVTTILDEDDMAGDSAVSLATQQSIKAYAVPVTLAGSLDYLTMVGQAITRNAIDLATDLTGNLPITRLNSGTGAAADTAWHGDGMWRVPAGLPQQAQVVEETSGTVALDPTADQTRFFEISGTLTGDLTLDLSTTDQVAGPPVFLVWEGVNGAFSVIVETHSGETVELETTGWVVACYYDSEQFVWRTMGRYKKNEEVVGAKFARQVNTATSITANAALDETIQLLRGASAVAVSLAEASGSNSQIVLVKETDQVITVSVGGAAVYRLPGDDDAVTRTASFVVTGIVTLIGDDGEWLVSGSTDHASTLFAALDAADKVVSGAVLKDFAETAPDVGTKQAGISFDYTAGGVQRFTTGSSNISSVTVTNPPPANTAGSLRLVITQGGTARTIAWGAAFRFPSGTDAALTATIGAVDIFELTTWDGGATWYVETRGKAWAA